MGADSLAEKTPNAPEFVCQNPKVLGFNEKRLHRASVVRGESLLYISFTKLKTFHLNLLFFPHLRLCIFDHGN